MSRGGAFADPPPPPGTDGEIIGDCPNPVPYWVCEEANEQISDALDTALGIVESLTQVCRAVPWGAQVIPRVLSNPPISEVRHVAYGGVAACSGAVITSLTATFDGVPCVDPIILFLAGSVTCVEQFSTPLGGLIPVVGVRQVSATVCWTDGCWTSPAVPVLIYGLG